MIGQYTVTIPILKFACVTLHDCIQAKEGVEIRGCCFTHTAANEQHMSRVAADILKQEDIPAGNIPVAVWLYNIPEEPLPKV